MFHNSVFSFPKTEGLYFVCLLVNCVLKQEFQLACSTIPEKKREMFLCYYTNITAQLSSHLWTGTTFNILNVNVSLQQLHIVTPISCRICTLPSLSSMKDLMACCTQIYCSFVFSLTWKGKNVEQHSAFRCWDTCYILMFWHEQSVEIYFFPLHRE